ncbi:hypothetical protein [Desulfosudis oleivorans]|uniref:Uncharacterized protein n=1 Tax=Desulfosudis oleivorans (strain DSM 6200 / JCM 39069 / Hxd3) TaxID=96561 RepID=A8ZU67_DESOH|nr:hypothetical protein [Desulfosudis oleivorans]ABW66379.1 hypothetical protein Dole_0569 [Desulfosudis oleivorans Hxd3]
MEYEKILNPDFWKAFKIPGYALAVLLLLLLMRDINNGLEYIYIQKVANFAIGASIISYGHSMLHSTWVNRRKEMDLPFWPQLLALTIHAVWFGFFLYQVV